MKFRKKPVVIEAIQFDGTIRGIEAAQKFVPGIQTGVINGVGYVLCIPTLEGEMRANPGDWIIKGVKGEFYPCKPDIFSATYEPAEAVA